MSLTIMFYTDITQASVVCKAISNVTKNINIFASLTLIKASNDKNIQYSTFVSLSALIALFFHKKKTNEDNCLHGVNIFPNRICVFKSHKWGGFFGEFEG